MKERIIPLLLATCLAVACSPAGRATPTPTPGPPLPHSMKGYELYSWPVDGQWHFALITGTNRTKTVDEITTGEDQVTADGWVRIHVQGVAAIQAVLDRVPAGEWVFWVIRGWPLHVADAAGDITSPPQAIVDAVKEHAELLGLRFQVDQ